ncbi:WG repeat-containing protein [Vibrio sp. HN007]|uniref:WG repeat-containing protein n=1 Tax=Vibrio iocasae TaxID=3098914 RepID=UPI0035D4E99B
MINRTFLIISVGTFLSVLSVSSFAKTYSGTMYKPEFDTPLTRVAYADADVKMNISLRINWKFWTMFGEPVVDSTATWRLNSATVIQGNKTTNYYPCGEEIYKSKSCLPKEILKKFTIIDADIVGYDVRNNYASIVWNPGVFGHPSTQYLKGESSYNTPASPDWGKTIFKSSMSDDLDYYSETDAKSIYKNGIDFMFGKILKLDMAYSELIQHHHSFAEKSEIKQVESIASAQKKEINQRFSGSESDDIFAAFEREEAIKRVEQVEKDYKESSKDDSQEIKKKAQAQQRQEEKRIAVVRARVESHTLPINPKLSLVAFEGSNGKYGFKNAAGKVVIEPTYYRAFSFSEGVAHVVKKRDQKAGFIDTNQSWVIKPAARSVDLCKRFSDGMCIYERDYREFGAINKKGHLVIKPHYGYLSDFKNHTAIAETQENPARKGVIDKDEKVVIPFKHWGVSRLSDGNYQTASFLKRVGNPCKGARDYYNYSVYSPTGKLIKGPTEGWRRYSTLCLKAEKFDR